MYDQRMRKKTRLTVSLDADVVSDVESIVARGQAGSLSAWINDAVRLRLEDERKTKALANAIAEYEAEHGEITDEELRRAVRSARARAIHVRRSRASLTARPP